MFDLTSAAVLQKQMYPPGEVSFLMFNKDPFVKEVKKNPKFGGLSQASVQIYGASTGASGTYGSMGSTSNTFARWTIDNLSSTYHQAVMDGQAIARSLTNEQAFVEGIKGMTEGTLEFLRLRLENEIWGNGGRALCQLSATTSIATEKVFVADPFQLVRLMPNMKIQSSATDGATTGGSVHSGGGKDNYAFVDSVNIKGGYFTIKNSAGASINWTDTFNGAAAGDYVFQYGDFPSVLSGIFGIFGWIPTSDPSAGDSVWGVDRTKAPDLLAGHRFTATGYTIQESLITALMESQQAGAIGQNRIYLNAILFGKLVNEMTGKIMRSDDADQAIGFKTLTLMGPEGEIKVYCAPKCPSTKALITKIEDWELLSAREVPFIQNLDGLTIRKVSGSDSWAEEWAWYAQLWCKAPRNSTILSF